MELDELDAVHVGAAVHQEHDALDEAPDATHAERDNGEDDADNARLVVAQVELVHAAAAKEDSEESCDELGLGCCCCVCHDAKRIGSGVRVSMPPEVIRKRRRARR